MEADAPEQSYAPGRLGLLSLVQASPRLIAQLGLELADAPAEAANDDQRGLAWRGSVPRVVAGPTGEAFLESDWASYSGADTRPEQDELGRTKKVNLPGGQ